MFSEFRISVIKKDTAFKIKNFKLSWYDKINRLFYYKTLIYIHRNIPFILTLL